jgi:hypothetical protein
VRRFEQGKQKMSRAEVQFRGVVAVAPAAVDGLYGIEI